VFDVHPPGTSIKGWREFFIHLATITVGLLIALGLEGTVEWLHHRHVMHQAQASLFIEIKTNAESIQRKIASIEKHQAELAHVIEVLKRIIADPNGPQQETMTVLMDITSFDNVSWATAQSTGAVTYMPYSVARQYADIYSQQAEIDAQVHEAIRDFSLTIAPLLNAKKGDKLIDDVVEAKLMREHVEALQGQLYLVGSLMHSMDNLYKKFLAEHTGTH
jgi:hypothetical protein